MKEHSNSASGTTARNCTLWYIIDLTMFPCDTFVYALCNLLASIDPRGRGKHFGDGAPTSCDVTEAEMESLMVQRN